jgi:hypothetical protein
MGASSQQRIGKYGVRKDRTGELDETCKSIAIPAFSGRILHTINEEEIKGNPLV